MFFCNAYRIEWFAKPFRKALPSRRKNGDGVRTEEEFHQCSNSSCSDATTAFCNVGLVASRGLLGPIRHDLTSHAMVPSNRLMT